MTKFTKYLFFGFSFFLSIKTSISNFFIILILTALLIEFIITKKKVFNTKVILYSFAPIFIFSLMSLIWTNNLDKGLSLSSKHLALLLLPVFFSITSLKNNKHYLKYSLYGLLIGSIIISIILLVNIGFEISSIKELTMRRAFSSKVTSHQYTFPILKTHPSYLGMYALLSIAILIFNKIKINKYLKVLAIFILVTNILYLNARILYLLLFILLIFKIFSIKSFKIKMITVGSLILIFIAGLFIMKDTYIFKKLITGSIWEITHNVGTANTTDEFTSDSRLVRWKAAIEGSKLHPIIGYGVGSEMDTLLPLYKKNNLKVALERKFNTHNQYLYYLITVGLIGLVLFLFLLLQNIIIAFKNKDILMFYFFIIVIIISIVENVVYRNAGFTFLAVYVSLFNKQYLYK